VTKQDRLEPQETARAREWGAKLAAGLAVLCGPRHPKPASSSERLLHLAASLVQSWKASMPARCVRQLHAPALRAWAGQPGRNEINRHSPDAGRRRQGRAGRRPGVGPPAFAHVRPGGPGCHPAPLFPGREAASGGAAPRLPRHPRPGSCRRGHRLSISSPRISRAPRGSPHWLAVPLGGYGGQAELAHRPIPAAEADECVEFGCRRHCARMRKCWEQVAV